MKPTGVPFIISAPSGTGKSTVCKKLLEQLPDLRISVSHTTRAPRPTEKEGVDYFYISEEDFKQKIKENAFLEWAQVHNCYYGTAIAAVAAIQNEGNNILLEMDVQGVQSLRNMEFDGVFILILPPSIQELENRLRNRSTETEEKIQGRIEVGKTEITQYRLYDYVVTNHEIETAVKSIRTIMSAVENLAGRYVPQSKDIADILSNQRAKF